jgi:hypothetical protein
MPANTKWWSSPSGTVFTFSPNKPLEEYQQKSDRTISESECRDYCMKQEFKADDRCRFIQAGSGCKIDPNLGYDKSAAKYTSVSGTRTWGYIGTDNEYY